jgi:hypothetical protein
MTPPNYCDDLGIKHDFDEDYYGYKCQNCGIFYPYGCAPWEDDEDDLSPEDLRYMIGTCPECDAHVGQGDSHDSECSRA